MDAWTSSTVFVAHQDVVAADVGTESILLSVRSGTYFGLNRIGRELWKRMIPGASASELLTSLQSQFAVPVETLSADLQGFCGALLENDLISVSSPS